MAAENDVASPEDQGSCLSRTFFWWLTPLVRLGYGRRLEPADRIGLSQHEEVAPVYARFQRHWRAHLGGGSSTAADAVAAPMSGGGRPLARAIFATFRPTLLLGLCGRLTTIAMELAGPLLLREIVVWLQDTRAARVDPAAALAEPPFARGLWLAGALAGTQLVYAVVMAHSMYLVKRAGIGIRTVMVMAIFDKCATASAQSGGGGGGGGAEVSAGQTINMMSADANRFLDVMPSLLNLLCAPGTVLVATALIWWFIGPPILLGLAIMCGAVPYMKRTGRRQKQAQQQRAGRADRRLKVLAEVVAGMKTVKLQGWERPFGERVAQRRAHEGAALRRFATIKAWVMFMSLVVPVLATAATFVLYVVHSTRSP
jgi:ABC-type multidrug transport system fused ATPase/permease subunit